MSNQKNQPQKQLTEEEKKYFLEQAKLELKKEAQEKAEAEEKEKIEAEKKAKEEAEKRAKIEAEKRAEKNKELEVKGLYIPNRLHKLEERYKGKGVELPQTINSSDKHMYHMLTITMKVENGLNTSFEIVKTTHCRKVYPKLIDKLKPEESINGVSIVRVLLHDPTSK